MLLPLFLGFTLFLRPSLGVELDDSGFLISDDTTNWLAKILKNQDAETRDSLTGAPDVSIAEPRAPESIGTLDAREFHICVTLNPARVSSRRRTFVTYECFAQICSTDLDGPSTATSIEEYRFQRPLFDWSSQFSHMVLNNGTCSSDGLTCWNRIEVKVDSFIEAMDSTGVEDLEVRCRVADYAKNYRGFNYVTGEAASILRHYKGIAVHEPCNRTEDCGKNLICVPSSTENETSLRGRDYGYCECTTTTIESAGDIVSAGGGEIVKARSFVLVEDEDFRESMCLEVAQLNQTCRYDQQCLAADPESACRLDLSASGSVCDCIYALDASSVFPRCLSSPSNGSDSAIWWFFPPTSSTTSGSAFYYYSTRYQMLARVLSIFIAFVLMLLLVAIMVAIIVCLTRHRTSRQYTPRRMSNDSNVTQPASDQSLYYAEKEPKLEFYKTSPVALSLEGFGKKSTKEDKLDLVDHDQLGGDEKFP